MTSILKNSNYFALKNADNKCSIENLSIVNSGGRDFTVEKKMVKFNKVCKSLEVKKENDR